MIWIIIAVVVGLIIGIPLLAMMSHIKHRKIAIEKIKTIQTEEISVLAEEFRQTLQKQKNINLSDHTSEIEISKLESLIKSTEIIPVFLTTEFKWRFVFFLGAYMGEVMQKKGLMWIKKENEAPFLQYENDGKTLETYPFEKVLRLYSDKNDGDLFAYLNTPIDEILQSITTQHDHPSA